MEDIMNNQEVIDKIAYSVIQGNLNYKFKGQNLKMGGQPGVVEWMQKALNQNIDPKEIVLESLAKPMDEVFEKYEAEDYLAPHVLTSAKCVGVAMDMLAPDLEEIGIMQPKFVIAVVQGDYHEIGAKVVALAIKGVGYKTIDLGNNISANRIVETVRNHEAAYVGLSATCYYSREEIGHVITKLEAVGIRDEVKVVIGGVATSDQFAEQIGADAYCKNALQVPEMLKSLDNWSGFAGAGLEEIAA
jgi:5-methyltetrahydrofolate--homocysteine methyltransferase